MKHYKIESLKNRFQEFNPTIKPNLVKSFFSERNLIENISITNFYTNEIIKSAFLNEEDALKICLLAKLKFKGPFDLEKIKPASKDCELTLLVADNLQEFKSKMVEHYRNPFFVAKVREEKEKLNLLKIHKQDFSKNVSNYEVDINNKKIVSIDFEYNPHISSQEHDIKYCSECGVSVYENNEISTYHFLIEDGSHKTGAAKHLVDKFEFGETKIINSKYLVEVLKEILKDADFFISHGMENEYNILIKNDIDMKLNNTQILDTCRMFQSLDVDNKLKSYRLKDVIRVCNMNDKNLHNAGNDAAYTLKTFLEMNNDPENIKKRIKELANLYDETNPKRKAFKI
jgi:hypothetical protein